MNLIPELGDLYRREVGYSFEELIDSYLGVIADSTDNGLDLWIS
jgi:hypothetical protein